MGEDGGSAIVQKFIFRTFVKYAFKHSLKLTKLEVFIWPAYTKLLNLSS